MAPILLSSTDVSIGWLKKFIIDLCVFVKQVDQILLTGWLLFNAQLLSRILSWWRGFKKDRPVYSMVSLQQVSAQVPYSWELRCKCKGYGDPLSVIGLACILLNTVAPYNFSEDWHWRKNFFFKILSSFSWRPALNICEHIWKQQKT